MKSNKSKTIYALLFIFWIINIQSSKAFDWHWLINPYWQSEAVVPVGLNYYGSGDVNNDGAVNSEDVQRIKAFPKDFLNVCTSIANAASKIKVGRKTYIIK